MLNAKNQVNILSNIFLEIFELIPSPRFAQERAFGEGQKIINQKTITFFKTFF